MFYCCRRYKFAIKAFCTTVNTVVLLIVTCTSITHTEGNGVFTLQQWLRDRATLPHRISSYCKNNEGNKTSSSTWKVPSMRNVAETTMNHKLSVFANTIFRHSFQLFLSKRVGPYQDSVHSERVLWVTHSCNPFTAFPFQRTLQEYLGNPAIS